MKIYENKALNDLLDASSRGCHAPGMTRTKRKFTAVVSREDEWWVGFILEIPGVNCQGRTRGELTDNLHSALTEALELRRELALATMPKEYEEQIVLV